MGMYTELVMAVRIDSDEEKVINTLKYMLEEGDDKNCDFDHKLFVTDRWKWMLLSDSYYFDGETDTKLIYDHILDGYILNVRCNLKNYDREIELFLEWIAPHVHTNGFVGYMRYEDDEDPTLIYIEYDEVIFKKINN